MDRERLEELLDAYFDGGLDGAGAARLDAELRGSPEARRLFWERAEEHALIRELMLEASGAEAGAGPRPTATRQPAPRGRLIWIAAGLVAAAALVIAFILSREGVSTDQRPIDVANPTPSPVSQTPPDRTQLTVAPEAPMDIAAQENEALGLWALFEQSPTEERRQLRSKYLALAGRLATAYHAAAQKAAAKADREAQKSFQTKRADWLQRMADAQDAADVTADQLLTIGQAYFGIEEYAKARTAYERLLKRFDPEGKRAGTADENLYFLASYDKVLDSIKPPAFPTVDDMGLARAALEKIKTAALGEAAPAGRPPDCQIQLVGSSEIPDEKDPNATKTFARIKIRHRRPDAEGAVNGWVEITRDFAVGDRIAGPNWKVRVAGKPVNLNVDSGAKLIKLETRKMKPPRGGNEDIDVLFATIKDPGSGERAELKHVRYGGGWWPTPEDLRVARTHAGRNYEEGVELITRFLDGHPAYDVADGRPGEARKALADLRTELDLRAKLLASSLEISTCYVALGRQAEAGNRPDDARACFRGGLENAEAALKYWPRNPRVIVNKAICLAALGEPAGVEEAVKLLHELRRGIGDTDLWWSATQEEVAALIKLARYEEAKGILSPVLLTNSRGEVEKNWPKAYELEKSLNEKTKPH